MLENQVKGEGNEGQNHTNFGSIKYPQTYLLLVLEQNNHKSTPKTCIKTFQRFSIKL